MIQGFVVLLVIVSAVLAIASGIAYLRLERRQREFQKRTLANILTLSRTGISTYNIVRAQQEEIEVLASLVKLQDIVGKLIAEREKVSPRQGRK